MQKIYPLAMFAPIAIDYLAGQAFRKRRTLPFSNKAIGVMGAGALASRVLSKDKCFLMVVIYIAYKALNYYNWRRKESQQTHKSDFASRRLKEIPEDVLYDDRMSGLTLRDNKLTTLPARIGKLKKLTYLDLSFNQLTALPPEIGDLENLEEFYVSNNRLSSVPSTIGKLKKLNCLKLDMNRLTALPPEIGDLSSLKTLELAGNQLTSLPDSLARLPRGCMIDVTGNPLSREEISRIGALIDQQRRDSNGLRGPQLAHSIYESRNTSFITQSFYESRSTSSTTPSLEKAIRGWLEEYQQLSSKEKANSKQEAIDLKPYKNLLNHEKKADLHIFLDRLRTTKDYKEASSRKSIILNVQKMLHFASTNEKFREKLFIILGDASRTCGDRVTLAFGEIELQMLLSDKNLTDVGLAEILIGVQRKELLKKEADKRIALQSVVDPIEVYLRYELELKDQLKLPISIQSMLYAAPWVTPQMLKEDATHVLSHTTKPEQWVSILMSYDAWKEHVDSKINSSIESINEKYSNAISQASEQHELKEEEIKNNIKSLNDKRNEEIQKLQQQYTEQWVKDNQQKLWSNSK